ncbi:MAG: hypothetical protein IJN04_00295 [Clostridia bacterium]|nr:hypothetical protein [Clostridia bacterium]
MSDKKRPLPSPEDIELRANPVLGEPVDVWDQVNKYGTYEVQDTTDTDNVFPCIGYEGSGQACVNAANKMIKGKTN